MTGVSCSSICRWCRIWPEPGRRCRLLLGLLTVFGALLAGSMARAAENPLIFGLLPSESPASKFRRYAPLRDYLQRRLGRPLALETARDFAVFRRRTREGRYDVLETAPHFVPEALDTGRYVVITTLRNPLTAEIVVRSEGSITALAQLAGKIVATPTETAVITRLGKEALTAAGLVKARAPRYVAYPTHNAAYAAVLGGEAAAALISVNIYNKAQRQGLALRRIASSRAIPNMSILVSRELPAVLRNRLQRLLVAMHRNPAGRQVLQQMAYPGHRVARAEEFEPLRAYLRAPDGVR